MSAKTGVAPTRRIAFAVETKVKEGQIDLLAGPDAQGQQASSSAWVQEVVRSTRCPPSRSESRPSTLRPKGPSPAVRPRSASVDSVGFGLTEPGRRERDRPCGGRRRLRRGHDGPMLTLGPVLSGFLPGRLRFRAAVRPSQWTTGREPSISPFRHSRRHCQLAALTRPGDRFLHTLRRRFTRRA